MEVPGAGWILPISGGLALSEGSSAERHPTEIKGDNRRIEIPTARTTLPKPGKSRKHLSILDHGSQRNKIARVRQRINRAQHASFLQALDGVADGYREVQHHA